MYVWLTQHKLKFPHSWLWRNMSQCGNFFFFLIHEQQWTSMAKRNKIHNRFYCFSFQRGEWQKKCSLKCIMFFIDTYEWGLCQASVKSNMFMDKMISAQNKTTSLVVLYKEPGDLYQALLAVIYSKDSLQMPRKHPIGLELNVCYFIAYSCE